MSNPATPLEVENQQVGVDEHFMNKERKPDEVRRRVALDECIAQKDRAGIESSLLIAVAGKRHAGEVFVRDSVRPRGGGTASSSPAAFGPSRTQRALPQA